MQTRVIHRRLNPKNRTRARGGRRAADPRRACRRKLRNCIELAAPRMKSCNRLESLSNDPIGFAAGDANLYRYTGNQPTTRTDPSGLDWLDDWFRDPVNDWLDRGPRASVDQIRNSVFVNEYKSRARESAMVLANTITLGLHDEASRCADDAWQRSVTERNYVMQSAFYSSKAGGYATQMLVVPGSSSGGAFMRVGAGPWNGKMHFAWRIGGEYRHATRLTFDPRYSMEVTSIAAESFWHSRVGWKQVPFLPVLNPNAALAEGVGAKTCFTAAVNAYSRGNYYLPYLVPGGYFVSNFFGEDVEEPNDDRNN